MYITSQHLQRLALTQVRLIPSSLHQARPTSAWNYRLNHPNISPENIWPQWIGACLSPTHSILPTTRTYINNFSQASSTRDLPSLAKECQISSSKLMMSCQPLALRYDLGKQHEIKKPTSQFSKSRLQNAKKIPWWVCRDSPDRVTVLQ